LENSVSVTAGPEGLAEHASMRLETRSFAHRSALRLGTMLSGATLGGLVAWRMIEGSSSSGTDEEVLATSLIAGAVLGALTQFIFFEDALHPGSPNVGLIFFKNPSGIGLRYSF
jgi:hypothetical protein